MNDPLEHLEDRLFAHELIEEHRATLVREGRALVQNTGEVDAVGLILNAQTPEGRTFLEALERASGQELNVPGFLGLVPRAFAIEILRANAPAALDNMPNGEPGSLLPVLVTTKHGFGFELVDYGVTQP